MDIDTLESIYAHASWANGKLFDTAAQIAEVQLTRAADVSGLWSALAQVFLRGRGVHWLGSVVSWRDHA